MTQQTQTPKKTKTSNREETSKGSFKERYADCIKQLKTVPTVSIKGKSYSTVAERHRHLKLYFPESKIDEQLLFHDADRVIVKTTLYIADQPYASGHAEEFRNSSFINKTSAVENCASSSLGRCMAAFGLHGSEYASADELTGALIGQAQNKTQGTTQVSIKDKINKQTTETKLNALYSDWEQENDTVKKSFEEKQKNIKTNGGTNAKSW